MKRLIILLLLCCFLWGCGAEPVAPTTEPGTEPAIQTEPTTQTEPPTTATEPTTTVTEPTEPEEITLTLSFVGDCTLGTNQEHAYANSFHEYYDRKGEDYFLSGVRSYFEEDDLTVINLEGPLTNSNDLVDKQWNHKGPPKYVGILTGASVEVASLGNNHRLDYDWSGFKETLEVLENASIGYCYDDHYLIREVKGIRIGFVSVNEVYDGQRVMTWLEEGYEQLRSQGCQLVIACVHWGDNHTATLTWAQKTMGDRLIDLGYDLVVGHHPHVLQAMRLYKGKFICYSLGNFCYGGSKYPKDMDSGIFRQTFTFREGVLQPGINAQFIPCSMSGRRDINDYCPVPSQGEEFDRIIQKINGYSTPLGFTWKEDGTYTEP